MSEADAVARMFHQAYEELAHLHGYETRPDSAVAWELVPERNKALMTATVQRLLDEGVITAEAGVGDVSNTSSEAGGGVRAALEGVGPLPPGWREVPLAGGWEYAGLAAEIRAVGEPHPGSTHLQAHARNARMLCRVHGVLTPADGQEGMRGWASDWAELGELARDHVADNADGVCEVAVESWRGAVYAPGIPGGQPESEAGA